MTNHIHLIARAKENYKLSDIIRVGIVDKPEDYIFSSTRNYSGLEEKNNLLKENKYDFKNN